MKFLVRKYFSGYCTYEIEAGNEETAFELTKDLPIDYEEVSSTLEAWEECNEVKKVQCN